MVRRYCFGLNTRRVPDMVEDFQGEYMLHSEHESELRVCREFRADLADKLNQATAINLEKSREIERLKNLMAICYQIAGTIVFAEADEYTANDGELLLNTLARPNGPGAEILLANESAYQTVTIDALYAEKDKP